MEETPPPPAQQSLDPSSKSLPQLGQSEVRLGASETRAIRPLPSAEDRLEWGRVLSRSPDPCQQKVPGARQDAAGLRTEDQKETRREGRAGEGRLEAGRGQREPLVTRAGRQDAP